MARPPQEAIGTFMSITGASEAVALQKLEEHGGDLNEAVNAHFSEGDRVVTHQSSPPNVMDIDDPTDDEFGRPSSLLSAARNLNPFSLLDPNLGILPQNIFDGSGGSGVHDHGLHVSHPREVRSIPVEFKDNNETGPSGQAPTIDDVTGHESSHVPEIRGRVTIDDEDDDDDFPSALSGRGTDIHSNLTNPPSAPPMVDVDSNDIEEEMMRAAIEASKREAEGRSHPRFIVPDDLTRPEIDQRQSAMGDDQLARAVSLSIETTERERALRQQETQFGDHSSDISDKEMEDVVGEVPTNGRQGYVTEKARTSRQIQDDGNTSSQEETDDMEEQSLARNRPRRYPTRNSVPMHQPDSSPPWSPGAHDIPNHHQNSGGDFHSEEWGGISSEEHDEAVMLEAAMFGGIPEGTAYSFAYPPHGVGHTGSDRNSTLYPRVPRTPSPSLTAQRLLREQQDGEYLASLQADQEKELKAMQEAELRRLEEAATREAALAKQKQEEEENQRKLLEEEELERKLAAKQATLPQEPLPDDEGAITLLVRMPDGSRHGRRFLKSDKLQCLFDFIDIGRIAKPGSYRLVRPYPRRAFADGASELSFGDLGLTSKQEALFLELI